MTFKTVSKAEIHYVFCPHEIRKKRLIKRADSRDEHKLKNWEHYLQYYEDEPAPACEHFYIDNSADLEV